MTDTFPRLLHLGEGPQVEVRYGPLHRLAGVKIVPTLVLLLPNNQCSAPFDGVSRLEVCAGEPRLCIFV